MNLTVNNYTFNSKSNKYNTPQFKGGLGMLTGALSALDTNEMANAVLIDLGAMVIPRTYYDATNRNKDAGYETFFREISGTLINCLSAGFFAIGISHLITNRIMPDVKLRPNMMYSDDSVHTLNQAWKTSGEKTSSYVENVLNNMHGFDGTKKVGFQDIKWDEVKWVDNHEWTYITWQDDKYKNVASSMKTKDGVIKTLSTIIEDKNISKQDKKNVLEIAHSRITNALGVNRDLSVNIGDRSWGAKLEIILRDMYDMAKDVFTNKNVNTEQALQKIFKINKLKIFGALTTASVLGLFNQYANRKLTEKRTGKKGFVGDVDYATKDKNSAKNEQTSNTSLWMKKIAASIGMLAMVVTVMRVKNPADFVKKLQFTGPVTTGNAIKTVYAANIVGRFMAADNETELRESVTRDYFGFLNWLVLGGFAAKGVANLLDKNRKNLFNESKEGKGIKHWLNNVSLKTHAEVMAKGSEFAKKNIWKLNVAHISGLLYSGITLGYLLPMVNDKLTKMKAQKASKIAVDKDATTK